LLIYAQCQLANYAGNPEAALATCDQALHILPWSARVNKEIGTAYMQLGQLERANEYFAQSERFGHKLSVRYVWELKAGIASLLLGHNQMAEDWLKRAAVVNTKEPWIPALLAVAYNRLNERESMQNAMDTFKRIPNENANKLAVKAITEFYHFPNQDLNTQLQSIADEFEVLYDTRNISTK
jgi:tetratricopeptide (TPR) repeat protein